MFSFPTILFVICTAYTAAFDECGKTDGITTCGQPAIQGVTVACDGLPFGTEVVIDGHTYIVQDRFGGNYGKYGTLPDFRMKFPIGGTETKYEKMLVLWDDPNLITSKKIGSNTIYFSDIYH